MSTATKLEYLNDTKSLLKDSINSLGGEITSQTTFRQYATELDSIYASLPKVSGSGSNISLSPTRKGRITSQMNGDTLQDGTPTPDAPINIQTVTGRQLIEVCGKNLFDKSTMVLNAALNASSGYLYELSSFKTIYFPCDSNTTYTIQKIVSNRFTIGYSNENNTTLPKTLTDINALNASLTSYTFTTNADTKYVYIMVSKTSEETADIDDILNSIQIELGSQPTTYEAYQGQTKELNLGKNLFDKSNINKLDGYINSAGAITSEATNKTIYIPCKSNTTYTVSKIASTRFGIATYSTTPAIGSTTSNFIRDNSATHLTLTTGSSDTYIAVWYYNSNTDTLTEQQILDTIQIEKGSVATTYAPYFTPIKLNKIPNTTYQDYISGTPDNWVINRQVGEVVFTGAASENWATSTSGGLVRFASPYINNSNTASSRSQIVSNYFHYVSSGNEVGAGFIYARQFFAYPEQTITDVTGFKTWLASNNCEVDYVLDTPTTEAITNTELIEQLNNFYNAKSYNGQTNISVEGDLPMILDVSAIKGE